MQKTIAWKLSPTGDRVTLWTVNTEIIPDDTGDSARIQQLLRANRDNPRLFDGEEDFVREADDDSQYNRKSKE